MTAIFPGERVDSPNVSTSKLKIGSGLQLEDDNGMVATRAGMLLHTPKANRWWVEGNSRRYLPGPQESVIGQITGKTADNYRVDIGTAHPATLDALAFEGATKRNRPNLKINSLVYARVSLAHRDMDPELECFNAQTHKSDGFGELKGGFMTHCSLGLCRKLNDPNFFLLSLLGSMFPFEVAVGLNGRVWVNAKEPRQVIAIARCIDAVDTDNRTEQEIKKFVLSMGL